MSVQARKCRFHYKGRTHHSTDTPERKSSNPADEYVENFSTARTKQNHLVKNICKSRPASFIQRRLNRALKECATKDCQRLRMSAKTRICRRQPIEKALKIRTGERRSKVASSKTCQPQPQRQKFGFDPDCGGSTISDRGQGRK
jgi:hypothetical protein